jgi:hypothetical protein
MRTRRRPPIFCDLDETLIHAAEAVDSAGDDDCREHELDPTRRRIFGYDVRLRPEAHEILRLCREGGREVHLFTHATFGFAVAVAKAFDLGFDERSVFSTAMIFNCRRGLCPQAALIDDKPPRDPNTRAKIEALGIAAEQVWIVPAFEPPRFASARLFVAGLPFRLARLDRAPVQTGVEHRQGRTAH